MEMTLVLIRFKRGRLKIVWVEGADYEVGSILSSSPEVEHVVSMPRHYGLVFGDKDGRYIWNSLESTEVVDDER